MTAPRDAGALPRYEFDGTTWHEMPEGALVRYIDVAPLLEAAKEALVNAERELRKVGGNVFASYCTDAIASLEAAGVK